jgi:hypothetical protein
MMLLIRENIFKTRCIKFLSISKTAAPSRRIRHCKSLRQKSPIKYAHIHENFIHIKEIGDALSTKASSVETEVLLHGDLTSCKLIHLTEGIDADKLMIFLPGIAQMYSGEHSFNIS